MLILNPILEQIQEPESSNTSLGLRIKLAIGMALENNEQPLKAIRLLKDLEVESKQANNWNVYVGTCLSLAKLQERLYRKEASRQHLNEAQKYLQEYELEAQYPGYNLRMAAWHLNFGYPDSVQLYAKKVISDAELYQLPHLKAESYLIIAQLIDEIGYQQAFEYNNQSIEIRKALGDYFQLAKQFHKMTVWYSRIAAFQKALAYNDSTITATYLAIERGRTQISTLHEAYLIRGTIYEDLGLLDSAYYYMNRGYTQKINYIEQQKDERIIEIDERFKNDQKNQEIAAQKQQINDEQQRSLVLLFSISLILLLTAVLIYAYWRLQSANKRTQMQSKVINETNKKLALSLEQQVILQGEIHHRVKNNLQVIVSLLELQKEELKEEAPKASLEAMAGRIYSIAAIHEVLYQKEGENLVNFLEYTQKICNHFSNLAVEKKPIFNLQIPPKAFNLETLMPLGIILNELLTNSLKYAILPDKKLKILIRLGTQAEGYQLYYKDNGPGFSNGQLKNRKGGLGTYLLNSMSLQLMGSLETENNQGATYQISFQEKNKRQN